MKSLVLAVILSASLILVHSCDDKKTVCYFTLWGALRENSPMEPNMINTTLCSHVNVAFAVINTATNSLALDGRYCEQHGDLIRNVTGLKEDNSELKVLISVGGWNQGGNFAYVSADETRREVFANSVQSFLDSYGLDGIDLNWETPQNATQQQNFVDLIRDLRRKLGNEAIISAAVATNVNDAYDKGGMCESGLLDHIGLKHYNIHNIYNDNTTGFNAPLDVEPDRETRPQLVAKTTTWKWIMAGCEKSKLLHGLPFYGSVWRTNRAEIGAPATDEKIKGGIAESPGALAYIELCQGSIGMGSQFGGRVIYSTSAQIAEYHRESYDQGIVVTYDTPVTISLKMDWVRGESLGGAMVWEMSQDDFNGEHCGRQKFPLLNAVYEGLNKED